MNNNRTSTIWSIGLLNKNGKYLTAETFGYKVNSNGVGLKKKCLWTLHPLHPSNPGIYLKSHLDRYLSVDNYGNVTCDEEEPTVNSVFEIKFLGGAWTFLNPLRGYFLGANNENSSVICTSKVVTDSERWFVHLAPRPQINLKSVGRKRYARVSSEESNVIVIDAPIPWGADTLFTLHFSPPTNYTLQCPLGKLTSNGMLTPSGSPFHLEYHYGNLALKDPTTNLYLAPIGSKAVLKTRSSTVTKDELFVLEDSLPQAAFICGINGKYVSTKQGIDLSANQEEVSNNETFQLEHLDSSSWLIRTMQDKYWMIVENNGGLAVGSRGDAGRFKLEWTEGGMRLISNGKYVGAKRSGQLWMGGEPTTFTFQLINRPQLSLKCEQGYVGIKNEKLECNKSNYEAFSVEFLEDGVTFKAPTGYWSTNGTQVYIADEGSKFFIELRSPTKICVKSAVGYLKCGKNGSLEFGEEGTEFEF